MKAILKQALKAIFIALFTVIYFSCEDSGIVETQNTSDSCITATLSGWIPGSNKILYGRVWSNASGLYTVGSCPVDSQGNFHLCFISLSDTTTYPSDSIFYAGCSGGNVTFNPPDVRGAMIYNYRVKIGDTIVGAVDCNNFVRYDSIKAGDFEVEYVYVNKQVAVTGYKVCSGDTLRFDGTAKAGWNRVIKHYTRVSPMSKTILYDMIEPPGAVWEYHGD